MSAKMHKLKTLLQLNRKFNMPIKRLYHTKNGIYGQISQEAPSSSAQTLKQFEDYRLYCLVNAYRLQGHAAARTDLLELQKPVQPPELNPENYGILSSQRHKLGGLLHADKTEVSTEELVNLLREIYCGTLAAEFQHLQNSEERDWFAENFESIHSINVSNSQKIHFSKLMLKSQAFDHFLANKFTTVKRYGGEGAESAMVFYDELFSSAAEMGVDHVVMSMGHRGRLNLLTCLLKFPPVTMFQKMKGKREYPPDVETTGDVLSHLTSSVDLDYNGKQVHVTMLPNPSHLEAANPVAAGKARARMQSLNAGDYSGDPSASRSGDRVLCFEIHGDAAFSGQGIVSETFLLANVPHYTVGGTIHLIINNQIGYTTEGNRGRSSPNCSDVGRMISCPVIRVNADYPESIVKACRLAMLYRERFRKDIIIDYICYRKWGHNELDEPGFTQPLMYSIIRKRPNIPDAYADRLVTEGLCTKDELLEDVTAWTKELAENLNKIDNHIPKATHLEKQWSGMGKASSVVSVWDTGVPLDVLRFVGGKSVSLPSGFKVHHTLEKTHIDRRLLKLKEGSDIDWATAEILAIGSLLHQKFNVRMSGQDVGRGTFSQRHAMFVDQDSDEAYVPLNHMHPDQEGFFEVANSPLSEEAVLGFEYGFSIENPNILTIWEAQFGDFFNGAQIIIDTFITGGEAKWLLQSSLTLLLPHGMDGAGPEHSSCKIERFLQASDSKENGIDGDNVNIQIANPTTPAQYFHLLRRQMVRNFRKPLIVIGPKALLRHPQAVSNLADMAPGTTFFPVITDNTVDAKKVSKVVFVSGRHFYTLKKEREALNKNNVALVRVESLCPFPAQELQNELKKFSNASEFIWSQEEHRNQGAWSYMNTRFENVVGKKLQYVGRCEFPTPAVGIGEVHEQEVRAILEATFART